MILLHPKYITKFDGFDQIGQMSRYMALVSRYVAAKPIFICCNLILIKRHLILLILTSPPPPPKTSVSITYEAITLHINYTFLLVLVYFFNR